MKKLDKVSGGAIPPAAGYGFHQKIKEITGMDMKNAVTILGRDSIYIAQEM